IINPGAQSTIFASPTGTPGQLLEQYYNGVNTTSFLDPGSAVNATLALGTNVTTTRNLVVSAGNPGTKTIAYTGGSGTGAITGNVTLNDNVTIDVATGDTLSL